MPTIKDVARRAEVSISTVSRVLNDQPYVADELRRRVLDAIDELGYKPSRVAQRLRATKSQLVGVIFSDIANPFYIDVLRGIEHALSGNGMSVLISNANADQDRESELIHLMQLEGVAGLVIAPTREESPVICEAVMHGIPVVIVDRQMTDSQIDTVLVDNFKGALLAVQHLIDLGHEQISVISGPLHLTSGRERYAGYLQAMSDAKLEVRSDLTRFGDYRQSSGYALAQELITLPAPPTALLVANNAMTIGALNLIHQVGRTIPDEIAVIGFDDFSWAVSLNPPLTTIAQPTFKIGTRAAELLLARIADSDRPPRTVMLNTQLMVRESCGALSKGGWRKR